jgi:hypothetical protein
MDNDNARAVIEDEKVVSRLSFDSLQSAVLKSGEHGIWTCKQMSHSCGVKEGERT